MKKFRFRLERVLHHRQLMRDEKKRELMLKNMALQEAEGKLEALEKAEKNNNLEQGTIMTVERVMLSGFYAQRLQAEIVAQRVKIEEAREEVRLALDAYVESAREAKSLELLKERKLQEFTEYVQKEDEKFLDELSVMRRKRKTGETDGPGTAAKVNPEPATKAG